MAKGTSAVAARVHANACGTLPPDQTLADAGTWALDSFRRHAGRTKACYPTLILESPLLAPSFTRLQWNLHTVTTLGQESAQYSGTSIQWPLWDRRVLNTVEPPYSDHSGTGECSIQWNLRTVTTLGQESAQYSGTFDK